jgi:putative hydrolase
VRIFPGVEANILDPSGRLDLSDQQLQRLEFVMAGLHEGCGMDDQGIDRNTEAVTNVMANPLVRAISHPGNPAFPLHYETVVKAARETGTAIEINNSSFSLSREGSASNCIVLARLIATYHAPVVIGSDAHIAQGVGEFAEAVATLAAAGVPEEQVMNGSLERLLSFLGLQVLPAP